MNDGVLDYFEHQEYESRHWDENKDGIDKPKDGQFAEGVWIDYTKISVMTSLTRYDQPSNGRILFNVFQARLDKIHARLPI